MKTLITESVAAFFIFLVLIAAFFVFANMIPAWASFSLLGAASIVAGLFCNWFGKLLFRDNDNNLNANDFPHLESQPACNEPMLADKTHTLTHGEEEDEFISSDDELDMEEAATNGYIY